MAAGWNRVIGDDDSGVRAALDDRTFMDRSRPRPALFGDGHAAEHSVAALERHQGGVPTEPVEAAGAQAMHAQQAATR